MRSKALAVVTAAVLGLVGPISAQMAHRMKGSLRTTAGGPLIGANLAPKEQRQALAAAIDDLRGITRVQ